MAWVVLASSSLLDDSNGAAVSQEKLESIVERSGYRTVTLHNIMRNSSSITTATTRENVNKYYCIYIRKSMSAGSCNTVIGTRPTLYLVKNDAGSNDDRMNSYLACAVNHYLEHNKSEQTVILCDRDISPRKVKPLLTGDVTLYDSGVEKYYPDSNPSHYSADLARQREDLEKWISKRGVLLTHDNMFNGCEAENIIFLTKRWGGGGGGGYQSRSGPTRAVSQLCIVKTDSADINKREIKKHFTVLRSSKRLR